MKLLLTAGRVSSGPGKVAHLGGQCTLLGSSLSVHVCACEYVCVIPVCVLVCSSMHECVSPHMHLCVCNVTCVSAYEYVCASVHAHTYICVHVCET